MSSANNLPYTRTIAEVLEHWKATKFTGIAIFNVHLGVAHSVEFGRPDRLTIDHSEGQIRTESLTSKDSQP